MYIYIYIESPYIYIYSYMHSRHFLWTFSRSGHRLDGSVGTHSQLLSRLDVYFQPWDLTDTLKQQFETVGVVGQFRGECKKIHPIP